MRDFTVEEAWLVAAYMPESDRLTVIKKIAADLFKMEKDIRRIAKGALEKLGTMTDEEYLRASFEEEQP